MALTEYINVDAGIEPGENGSDVDEIISSMLEDGKIDESDKAQISALHDFFSTEKASQLDDTKQALTIVFQDMLQRGYTIEGKTENATLTKILEIIGMKVKLSSLFEAEKHLSESKISLKLEDDGKLYVHAEQQDSDGDIIKYGYFNEEGNFVQEKLDDWLATEDFSDNNKVRGRVQSERGGFGDVSDIIDYAIARDLTERKDVLIGEQTETISVLEGEKDALEAQVSVHEGTITGLEGKNDTLAAQVATHETTITRLEGEKANLNSQIAELDGKLSEAEAQNKALQQAMDTILLENHSFVERLDKANADLATLKQEAETGTAELAAALQTIEAKDLQIQELQVKLAASGEELADTDAKILGYTEKITSLKTQLAALESTQGDLSSEKEALSEQIAKLMRQLEAANATIKTHSETIANLKAELSSSQEELDAIKTQQNTEKANGLREEYAALQTAIAERSASVDDLKHDFASLKERASTVGVLGSELTALEGELNTLSQEVDLKGGNIKISSKFKEAFSGLEGVENPTRDMILGLLGGYVEKFSVWNSAEQKEFWSSAEGYHTAYAVQVGLAAIGENPGTIDGIWGRKSGKALQSLGHGKVPGPKSIGELVNRFKAI